MRGKADKIKFRNCTQFNGMRSQKDKWKSLKNSGKSCNNTNRMRKVPLYSSVECDMYFNPMFDNDLDLSSFLSGAVLNLKNLSRKRETESMAGKWMYIEISQGPKFLLQKLWQLERAAHLLPLINANFNPSNLVVLLNGDEEEANFAMNNVIIPPEAKIMQYPLFVGWTPTRNIFKILASFQEKVDAGMKTLETDMTSMKVDNMAIMKTLETPASS